MKLEGLALTAIVLAVMSNACASGATDAPAHRGGPAGLDTVNGGEADGGGGDTGGYTYSAPDSGSPVTPDAGSGVALDSGTMSPTVDSGAATDTGSAVTCGASATQSACAECCGSLNPAGVSTLNTAIQACACGTSGTCATECATEVCADIPASSGDACFTCLSAALATSGPCYASVQAACTADPGCSAYLACESAECSGLP